MRLAGFIFLQLAAVSSNFTTPTVNHRSTTEMDKNERENAEKIEKSLDLESRYKQLSKTLSQINGDEENHAIFDRSSSSHMHNRHKSQNFSREGSRSEENFGDESSGSMTPVISDDDDYSVPELEGSGSPATFSNSDLEKSNENHIVDILSENLDFAKEIGSEEISIFSTENSLPATVTMATLADTPTSVATELSKTVISTKQSIFTTRTSQQSKRSQKITSHMTRQPISVSHVTSTSRTTQIFVPKIEPNQNRAENFRISLIVCLMSSALLCLCIF